MKSTNALIFLMTLMFFSCNSDTESEGEVSNNDETEESTTNPEDTLITEELPIVPEFTAVVDKEAMDQVGQYVEGDYNSAFELYHSEGEIEGKWTDKLWGRCCTEADLSLCEVMSFNVEASSEGSKYPWSNATSSEDAYNTTYVYKVDDDLEITVSLDLRDDQWLGPWEEHGPLSKIIGDDTIMSRFQFSLINGYVKSEKTFKENARVEWVELWLNGELKCLVKLLDTPEIQMIEGNFPFMKDDEVTIVPVSTYAGSKYDDICISSVQTSLGYSCDLELLKKGDKIAGITWRGYE